MNPSTTGSPSNRTLALANLHPPAEHAFSPDEYRRRLERIRAAMQASRIDLLYLSAPESICYVSGHQASWYQGQAASDWHPGSGIAIACDGDGFIQFEDEDEGILSRITSACPDIRLRGHDGDALDWPEFICSELAAAGLLKGTVGLELFSSRPNRGYSQYFQAALERHDATVTDGTHVVRGVRRLKSAAELECVRRAQEIADVGMRAAQEVIRPGVTELEASAEILAAMARVGGEIPGVPPAVVSGERNPCVHALAGRRVMQAGDLVNVDLCGVFNRYHASLARPLALGEPSANISEYADRVAGGVRLMGELLRPGLPADDLLSALRRYYEDAGIWGDQWWIGGYELGIAFPPDTVGEFYYEFERDPSDKRFDPGLVCNFESNFYLPDGAGLLVMTTTLGITGSSAGFLSEVPAGLTILAPGG
jgi:Xaa-Pro dipeptidase